MSITRINKFEAAPGKADELKAFLLSVISILKKIEGCLFCVLFLSEENAADFVIIETWTSIEAHQASAGKIPQDMFADFGPLIASAPSGTYYTGITE